MAGFMRSRIGGIQFEDCFMKRITIFLNSGEHINIPADEMERSDTALLAWRGDELVVYADTSAVICAYLSEKG